MSKWYWWLRLPWCQCCHYLHWHKHQILFKCTKKKLYSDKDLLNWRRKTEFVGEKTALWLLSYVQIIYFLITALSYSLYNTRALLIIFWCTDLKHLRIKEKNAFFCGNTNRFKLVSHADQQVNKTKTKTPRVGKLVLFFSLLLYALLYLLCFPQGCPSLNIFPPDVSSS